jgi:hypothetical protein
MEAIKKYVFFLALITDSAYAEMQPEWVRSLRAERTTDAMYSVGFAESEDLNKALSNSWNAALADAVRINLPELTTLGEFSKEGLRSSEYERNSGMDLDRISIKGVSEANNKRSPYVETSNGKYKVWRLLEWTKSGIEATRQNITSEQNAIKKRQQELKAINEGYSTQEDIQVSRNTIEKAKATIANLNKVNTLQDQINYQTLVLENIKCGTKYMDIEKTLGSGIWGDGGTTDWPNTYDAFVRYSRHYIIIHEGYVVGLATLSGKTIKHICQ